MNDFYMYYVDFKFIMLQQFPNVLLFLCIILGSWFTQRYLVTKVFKKLIRRYDLKQNPFKKEVSEHIEKPTRNFVFGIGILFAIGYLLNKPFYEYQMFVSVSKTLLLFYFFQCLYYVTSYFGEHPEALKNKFSIKAEDMLFPFFARVVKVFIFVFGFVMIAFEWGYDINGFVAGLGIGGLALALGAKDVLSHIFAGMALAIDKPFNVGDLISTDSKVEGIVEDMNFRSTKIRTLDKALVSVPNAVIANEYIYNWTRRKNRRVKFFISLTHDTDVNTLKKTTERIRKLLDTHDGVEEDSVMVAFDSYTPHSLDILILYVTNTSDFNEFTLIKEELNYEILDVVKNQGLTIALPAQSIRLHTPLNKKKTLLRQTTRNSSN